MGELAEAINDLSNQLSQNEKMQSEFISSLSHELRTPLTAITGWSETLLGGDTLDAETARGMRIILRRPGGSPKWWWTCWISPGCRTGA